MSKLVINTGTTPNDGTGDSLFAGAGKINSNFTEIYTSIGDGTTLGIASFSQVNVSGASTFAGITTVTGVSLFTKQLSVSGVSTFAGITTVTGVSLFARQLSVVGVLTATSLIGQVNSGVATITTLGGTNVTYATGNFTTGNIVTGVVTTLSGTNATYATGNFTTGNIVTGIVTNISGTNLNYTGIATVGSFNIGATQVISSGRQLQNIASLDATTTATIESAIANAPNTFTDINVSGLSTFAGITTVTGVSLFSRQLSVSGVSTFAGITTVTGETLFSRQLSVSGVSTLGTLRVASGIVTATSGIITYYGDGSKLTGISAGGGSQWVTTSSGIHTLSNVGIGTTNSTSKLTVNGNVLISGIATVAGGLIEVNSSNGGRLNFYRTGSANANRPGSLTSKKNISWSSDTIVPDSFVDGNNSIFSIDIADNTDSLTGQFFAVRDPYGDIDLFNSAAWCIQPSQTGWEQHQTWFRSSGKVGFGTTNPSAKVDVRGDLLVTGIATVGLANTSTPPNNSQLSFELISDTQLRIKVRGSDGVLRSADITLA